MAFDTIDYQILIQKLELHVIRGVCLRWISDYLMERQQGVSVNNCNSSWLKLNCGVPQGSILGPLLFLIYIIDLPDVCQVFRTFLFADDTNLTAVNSVLESIQKDLVNVEKWLNANKLSLNPEKSCQICIEIGKSASNFNSFSVFKINSVNILESESCKNLGVRLDKKLKFTEHIEDVKKKLAMQCGIVSKLGHYVPKRVFLQFYSSIIKPIIQHGVLIYGCVSCTSLQPLVLLQKRF